MRFERCVGLFGVVFPSSPKGGQAKPPLARGAPATGSGGRSKGRVGRRRIGRYPLAARGRGRSRCRDISSLGVKRYADGPLASGRRVGWRRRGRCLGR